MLDCSAAGVAPVQCLPRRKDGSCQGVMSPFAHAVKRRVCLFFSFGSRKIRFGPGIIIPDPRKLSAFPRYSVGFMYARQYARQYARCTRIRKCTHATGRTRTVQKRRGENSSRRRCVAWCGLGGCLGLLRLGLLCLCLLCLWFGCLGLCRLIVAGNVFCLLCQLLNGGG